MSEHKSRTPPNHLIPDFSLLDDEKLTEAADLFATPLLVYEGDRIAASWEKLSKALPKGVRLYYSVKANPLVGLLTRLRELGAGFEVSGLGELLAAKRGGAEADSAIFLGPGKSQEELEWWLKWGGGVLVAESRNELERVRSLAWKLGVRPRVALRVNTHTGCGEQRMAGATPFGIEIEEAEELLRLYGEVGHGKAGAVELVGVHGFLGTRILDWRALAQNVELVLEAADRLQRTTGQTFTFVDVGGGFGTPLYEGEEELDLASLALALNKLIGRYLVKYPGTIIAMESGRYLVAGAGVLVTRVLDVKRNGGKLFVIVDGGLHVLGGRDGYYGARCTSFRLLGAGGRGVETFTVCGPLCTPLDRLASDVEGEVPRPGDLLAFYLAGAYGPTAGPGLYLSRGFPAEVLADENGFNLMRPPTDLAQLVGGQMTSSHGEVAGLRSWGR